MTTMKLSDAIRLGAMLKPQGFGAMDCGGISTCALGAALDAVGSLCNDYDVAFTRFPQLLHTAVPCPGAACDCWKHSLPTTLADNIYCLNDTHGWTRERIADWVATIEAQHPIAGGQEERAIPARSGQEVANAALAI